MEENHSQGRGRRRIAHINVFQGHKFAWQQIGSKMNTIYMENESSFHSRTGRWTRPLVSIKTIDSIQPVECFFQLFLINDLTLKNNIICIECCEHTLAIAHNIE